MTALSDALTAAQARALATVQKAYHAGAMERDEALELLAGCGINDRVDTGYLFHALDVLREWGAAVPAESNGKPKEEAASKAQTDFIAKLLTEKKIAADDFPDSPLTKAQAHEIIDTLQSGTYDPSKWKLPF